MSNLPAAFHADHYMQCRWLLFVLTQWWPATGAPACRLRGPMDSVHTVLSSPWHRPHANYAVGHMSLHSSGLVQTLQAHECGSGGCAAADQCACAQRHLGGGRSPAQRLQDPPGAKVCQAEPHPKQLGRAPVHSMQLSSCQSRALHLQQPRHEGTGLVSSLPKVSGPFAARTTLLPSGACRLPGSRHHSAATATAVAPAAAPRQQQLLVSCFAPAPKPQQVHMSSLDRERKDQKLNEPMGEWWYQQPHAAACLFAVLRIGSS